MVVVAFTDDPDEHRAALLERRPSPDDVAAVDPPPAITDDRSLGERDDVVVDVVPAAHTLAELESVGPRVDELIGAGLPVVGFGVQESLNRLAVDLVDPTDDDLTRLAAAVPPGTVCVAVERTRPPPSDPLDAVPVAGSDPLVTCGGSGSPFRYSAFADPTPVGEVDSPAVDALVAFVSSDPAEGPRGTDGWGLLVADPEAATFIRRDGEVVELIAFEAIGDQWRFAGSSAGECALRIVLPEGLAAADVALDPNSPPNPNDTEVHLLVTELGCAGGQPMGDLLRPPQVVERDDAVLVAVATAERTGAQTCPSNPAEQVTVSLSAPLGDRPVLDGLRYPAVALEQGLDGP